MSGAMQNAQQSLLQKTQGAQQAGIAQPAPAPSYIQPAPRTGVAYYQSTLEPMQMLQAARAGQPFLNHVFQRPPQFLPADLPAYAPLSQVNRQSQFMDAGGGLWSGGVENAGPGSGDSVGGGVGDTGGVAGGVGDGSGGGGGGGGK